MQYLSLVNGEHERISEAIFRRNPEGARAAMRAHLTSSRERLRRAHDAANSNQAEPGKRALAPALQPLL